MRRLVLMLMAGLALGGLACGKKPTSVVLQNLPPSVRLTAAPPTYSQSERYFYSITLNWIANDPDGRVDHYLVAVVDLPGVRATLTPDSLAKYAREPRWIRTDRSDTTIRFGSTYSRKDTAWADDSHIFMIKAVDNQGAESEVQQRAFFTSTLAPTVQILSPKPSRQSPAFITPSVLIRWDGDDQDGVLSRKPVKYKYILLNEQSEIPHTVAMADRDTLRRYYAPRAWAGWDSTSTDSAFVQFKSLIPQKDYLFVVVAFDEAGAYSPIFTRDSNMLLMRVTFAGNNNPTITMFNEFFFYSYPAGSYEPLNPERVVQLEIPADEQVTFNWFALPNPGAEMRSYRWALDILDLNDNTERSDQETDLAHWSPKLLTSTSATIGPFKASATARRFYIEAEDINGLRSLGMIAFTVVQPAWTLPGDPSRPLLVVKDWRLEPDRKLAGATCSVSKPPSTQWPTAAELDTFLFARGGVPYQCYNPGDLSSPGIFKGFDFDTLGTRRRLTDQTVRLSTLAQYRHVVWIADKTGAVPGEGTSIAPMSSLSYMTGPNRANTLATYVRMGGRTWVLGGGAMNTTLWPYDRVANNVTTPAPSKTYSFDLGELVPGRFMYDIVKWQSEAKAAPRALIEVTRNLGRNTGDAYYANLPARLDYHSEAAGDTFPLGRARIDGNFYYITADGEYMSRPNTYYADLDPGPGENLVAAMDTLYELNGVGIVPVTGTNPTNFVNACMTVYPARSLAAATGAVTNQVIFSGFDIWSWRKTQCRALVQFVLKDVWGLDPNARPGPSRGVAAKAGPAPALSPRAPRPGRAAPGVQSETAPGIRNPRATRSGTGRGE